MPTESDKYAAKGNENGKNKSGSANPASRNTLVKYESFLKSIFRSSSAGEIDYGFRDTFGSTKKFGATMKSGLSAAVSVSY
jgi:hypothetical protein